MENTCAVEEVGVEASREVGGVVVVGDRGRALLEPAAREACGSSVRLCSLSLSLSLCLSCSHSIYLLSPARYARFFFAAGTDISTSLSLSHLSSLISHL